MTSHARYTLRIDMEDFENATRYAVYSNFSVASEDDMYRLSLGAYTGTAGDSLTWHDGMAFSTMDRDNDVYTGHCAQLFMGGWWYKQCGLTRLNGVYHSSIRGISWYRFSYSLKKVEMKLRP
ncbi:Tenascin-R [Lamellibrachia satsuma]|nr:Tenascin-R [Lamellibrachia satsuma]